MKIDEIETNSEQIREILDKAPSNILRWGISIIFIIVFAMFLGTWIIKYPTVIPAKITVTSETPPHKIIAKVSGKIVELFVNENDKVKSNQIIAILENTAAFTDIQCLTKEIEKHSVILLKDSLINFQFKDDLKLGSIQVSYVNFKNSYEEFQEFNMLLKTNKEIQILKKQIIINEEKLNSHSIQLNIYDKELSLSRMDYDRDKGLFNQNIISSKELEDKKRTLLSSERNYESVKNNKSNVQIVISNLKKNLNSITISSIESKSRLSRNVKESYSSLKNSVLTWNQNYLLISPIDGIVSFFNYWAKNQHVKIGDEVLSVVPKNNKKIIGRMLMPIQNSGQVKQNQRVLIRLSAYPYQQYGVLVGKVKSISLLPSQETYAVEVELPLHLKTTFNKDIELKSELYGTAEVITEDLRLLERVFYQIRKIFN